MPVRFQLRRDISTSWSSVNPTLEPGEPGLETDTFKLKIGDGATNWNNLSYYPLTDFQALDNLPTTLAGYGITDGYDNSDVDAHLNTGTATTGEVLSWNGADYDWVAQSGGGGIALTDLSVTSNAAGSAALTYNNTTGVFSYTPPDLSSYLTSYTETDPVFSAHTTSNITNGTGFLKNNGSGTWSYDNNTYLTSETSHADVLVDGDFTSAGIMTTNGAGVYSVDTNTYLTSETTTTLTADSVNTKLVFTDETGTANNVDLSWAVDDTNLARLTSGTLDALTGIATFTRDDATTFTVDFSALLNITLADLSVTQNTASGNGTLTYNNTTGVFSYTPPDLSGYETTITAGTSAQYYRGDKTFQTLDAAAVGLGNVTNESKATMFTDPTFTGFTTLEETTEVTSDLTGATGVVAHDLSNGAIFDHTSLAADFTANFTNVPTTASRTISVALILTQGGTAYMPTAVQIDGVAQTILWQGGSAPTGTASGTDVVSFTMIRSSGGAWKVIGSATGYA